jgi:hypothetical protein
MKIGKAIAIVELALLEARSKGTLTHEEVAVVQAKGICPLCPDSSGCEIKLKWEKSVSEIEAREALLKRAIR